MTCPRRVQPYRRPPVRTAPRSEQPRPCRHPGAAPRTPTTGRRPERPSGLERQTTATRPRATPWSASRHSGAPTDPASPASRGGSRYPVTGLRPRRLGRPGAPFGETGAHQPRPADSAGVAQWQSPSLPSWPCGFDSRHPLHATSRDTVHRCLATSFTCPARRRGERPQPDSGLGDRPRRLGKRQRVQPPLKADRPAVLVAPAVPETELAQPPPGPLAVTHHIGPMTKSETGEPDASSWAPLTSWTRARIIGPPTLASMGLAPRPKKLPFMSCQTASRPTD
jgi:hypothetical protein